MEALYAKLYNKYCKLKKEKELPSDQLNREQELKFLNYVAAADEMIEFLNIENHKLLGQVNELKSELASTRSSSDEQPIDYRELLQKNKELSEEISKLKMLVQESSAHAINEENHIQLQISCQNSPAVRMPRNCESKSAKKRKSVQITEGVDTCTDGELECQADNHVSENTSTDIQVRIEQPVCCQKMIRSSGGDAASTEYSCCLFESLVESLVHMKVSALPESNEPCILLRHQSSGFSFSLTRINKSHGEAEFLYRMLTLGTFEHIAPEWMREMLLFSTSMCRIFFERVSHVIKL